MTRVCFSELKPGTLYKIRDDSWPVFRLSAPVDEWLGPGAMFLCLESPTSGDYVDGASCRILHKETDCYMYHIGSNNSRVFEALT